MTTDAETLVRRAYHAAEGNVMDVQGFIDLFADDGVINAGQNSYRGEQLSYVVLFLSKLAPDVHRELHRVHVMGNVVAVELSIRGTFSGPYASPAGVIQPTGAKLDVPGADLWYVGDGKIKEFNCYISVSILLEQMGIQPNFAAAVGAQPAVELNHTIVHAQDPEASARFMSEVFGLPEPVRFGHFEVVRTGNGVSLDYSAHSPPISPQHYAFLVSEAGFDEIFGRVKARGLPYWADPMKTRPGEINRHDGGRGVYFPDPSGHFLEIITPPYGSGA
jgi:catechol 2,3-dioxygenase-like lactoylglutathione lyase family enzyme